MTKQDWANGFRWMRDKFAGWLASVTVFSFLWVAVIVAVSVLFVWDGVWSRHQAPSSLDPITFQAAGWTLRLWTVFGLAAALWCFRHAAHWVGGFFIVTWIATSVMTYGHALGFMMGGQAERYATGAVAEKTVEITTVSLDDQIAELEKQKAEIRADLLLAVTPLNEEIKRLDTDGKLNEELANKQKARRDTLQDVAAGKIEALDKDIRDLRLNHKADQIAGTEAVAVAAKFDPLYLTLAEWTDGKPGRPDDETARAIGQKTGAFWALLVEMIGGLGAALLYSVHAHMAARKPKGDVIDGGASHDVPPGHVRVEVPEDEWNAMQEAMKVHGNIKAGAKKGARTRRVGNKIEAGDNYYRDKISEFMVAHNAGQSTAQIAAKAGLTVASLRSSYLPHMTQEEQFALFGIGYQDEPEAEPPVVGTSTLGDYMPEVETPEEPEPPVAVADSPQEDEPVAEVDDELEIPDEPKEWPMAPYEAPANDDPDKEEAA